MPFKNPHPLYNVWASMRDRCRNPNSRQWNDYGGRGITICSRWDDFHVFAQDMGDRPDGYTLDRIDNDKGYSPDNCRWASRKDQQRNRRIAVYVTVGGDRYRAVDLAEQSGLKTDTIVARAAAGLSLEEVMSPIRRVAPTWHFAVEGRKRAAQARTHCREGHAFDAANTRVDKNGWKHCRTCHNNKARRYNDAKRGSR